VPYDTYRIHQIERARSHADVRRAGEQAAQLASVISSLFHGIPASASRAQAIPGRSVPAAPPGLISSPVLTAQADKDSKRSSVPGLA
jgi:hypothetical protein